MERKVGTVSRGVRCPIIREGDNLVDIVVDSVLGAAQSEGFELRDCKIISGHGWNEVLDQQCNDHYEHCLIKEFDDIDREEARLLYVALTRAIRRLECFVIGNNPHSWANMLEV